jgi:hypothetical protein
MAISTGAELATAVSNWLARADLATRIPEFVKLSEAKLNREIRTPEMLVKENAFSITGEYVAVPTGFLEARSFMLNASPRRAITFMPDDTQADMYSTGNGDPVFFSVVGSNFRFAPVPSATQSATLTYYKAPATNSTGSTEHNWLLDNHPDLCLYAALLEASGYIQDDSRVQLWASAYSAALDQLKRQGARMQWGGNGMMVRAA